jgi:glucose/arabinose dehydrogenase
MGFCYDFPMNMNKTRWFMVAALVGACALGAIVLIGYFKPNSIPTLSSVDFLTPAQGVSVSVYAAGLTTPRVIAFDPRGRIFISEMTAGRVTRLDDTNNDGIVDTRVPILEELKTPHGLAFYTDSKTKFTYLYIAEVHQVARYVYDVGLGVVANKSGQNIMNFPKVAGQHITRTIGFANNIRIGQLIEGAQPTQIPGAASTKKLYASVGSTCDACIEYSWKSGALLESDTEGQYTAEIAGGLRNSVFFAFHPVTGQMWATEMGRDNLGNDLPPDEINIITENDKYGWPFCYGNKVQDTTFTPAKVDRTDIPQNCSETKAPVIEIPAHSAPLGLGFVPAGKGWPSDWVGDLIVAYHGSENSTVKRGYKVVRYDLNERGNVLRNANSTPKVYDLMTGWYDGSKVLGRPVDIKFSSDGTLYISDDMSGRIYRVVYDN